MKKILLFLVMVFALIGNVSALTQVNIYVDSFGDSLFLGQTNEQPILPDGIEIVDGKISGLSSELTSKEGDSWTFNYSLSGAEMTIILPVGAKILSLSDGEIFLERDQIAIFVREDIEVRYTIEKSDSNFNNIALTVIGALFLVGLVFYIKNYIKGSKSEDSAPEKEDKFEAVKEVLNERERLIMEKLKETGKIKSSYLRKQLEIPKASFSRHLQELEKKGLVKRTGEGKNKIIEPVE